MRIKSALEFRDVSYRYPRATTWALRDLNFTVAQGEFVAVIGPNGAGKTSLCKCVDGIIPHSEGGLFKGHVTTSGLDTRTHTVAQLARHSGLVLEDPDAQLFATTVLDEVAFGPENLGLDPASILPAVHGALKSVGLSGFERRSPTTLSGGQKQRLAVAAALSMQPRLLVLDEATSQLDGEGAESLMDLARDLRKDQGMTVIMATHDVDLVRRYADRVLRLEAGQIIDFDRPERVIPAARVFRGFTRPQTSTTRRTDAGLVFEKLHHAYPGGIVALRGVDLRFGAGEFVGVVGRNGSGKTTLLKCAVSLLSPSSGRVLLNGKNLKTMKVFELAQSVGYVQQNPDLQLFADTVRKEVSFGPENLGFSNAEIGRKTDAALRTAGLEAMADEHPLGLGRGERGLTVLASVLAMEPAVLLLDEPTRGQDADGCSRIMEIALKARDAGCAVIAVGHDLGLLAEYVDRLVVMDGGLVVADGPPRTILENVGLLRSAGLRPPEKSGNLVVPGRRGEGVYVDEACEDIQETVCAQ